MAGTRWDGGLKFRFQFRREPILAVWGGTEDLMSRFFYAYIIIIIIMLY